ncbi:MAG TPA: SA1362 family protein [Bacillales bacterium]|nr:SA1362 family protein [Bacillales bacterium]
MSRRMYNPLALILVGLGALGLVVKIVTNPLGMLELAVIAAAIAATFVFLYRRFLRKSAGRGVSGYQRAARQSLKLRKKQNRKPHRPSYLKVVTTRNILPGKRHREALEKRKKEHNLKVIDGKKRKKKNRALF